MSPGEELALAHLCAALFAEPPKIVRVGPYELRAKLGEGGFGEVFLAFDTVARRDVAIKLLHHDEKSVPAQRLIREGRAIAALQHPNIVKFYDLGELSDTSSVYVAMEYVEGETVRAWIEREEPSWERIMDVFISAGLALAYAHERGIVHRDFKPSNVMLTANLQVKVLDFGLVRRVEDAIPSHGFTDRLTSPGTVLGTPLYMAPEQHLGQSVGPAADQYAFCAALFHMLYDQPPFEASNPILLARAKDLRQIVNVDRTLAPTWLYDALFRGLAPRPEDRWPDMAALIDRLRPRATVGRRPWEAFVLLGVGILVAVIFAAIWTR